MVMCALYNKIKIYSILFKEFRAKFMNFVFALYGRMEINSVLPLSARSNLTYLFISERSGLLKTSTVLGTKCLSFIELFFEANP